MWPLSQASIARIRGVESGRSGRSQGADVDGGTLKPTVTTAAATLVLSLTLVVACDIKWPDTRCSPMEVVVIVGVSAALIIGARATWGRLRKIRSGQ
jgi:hypothetical protein